MYLLKREKRNASEWRNRDGLTTTATTARGLQCNRSVDVEQVHSLPNW
jgi:hypothetical protein